MDIGLYQGAASLDNLQNWQNAISHNLAYSTAAGFKKAGVAFAGQEMGAMQSVTQSEFGALLKGLTPGGEKKTMFTQGPIIQSEQPTHVALQGNGFFEVEDPNGDTLYTRDGQFQLGPDGQLVTKSGLSVRGRGGFIQTVPGDGPLSFDARGNVYQGSNQIGTLAVSTIDRPDVLVPRGTGFALPAGSDARAEPLLEPNVISGAYEGSNVSPIEEMVKMIQVSRTLEANQKVMQSYDDRYDRSLQAFRS
jgi:flagellar basal body rod protein FlgG